MSAPETQCAAHEARRAGATQAKPQRTRGIVLSTMIDGECAMISDETRYKLAEATRKAQFLKRFAERRPPPSPPARFARPFWFDEPRPEAMAAPRPGLAARGQVNSWRFRS